MMNTNKNPETPKKYDYIFIGAGLSTLLILHEMSKQDSFKNKTMLVLDPQLHHYPSKTWCFWTKDPQRWSSIATKSWNEAAVLLDHSSIDFTLNPYQYQMLKSRDFRDFVFTSLKGWNNIEFSNEKVVAVHLPFISTEQNQYQTTYLFDSRFDIEQLKYHNGINFYQQFLGITIQFEKPILNADKIRLMDFRLYQPEAVAFCYVLPTDSQTVLVEYTLFTENLVSNEYLQKELEQYVLKEFPHQNYSILDKEEGIIPMSDIPLNSKQQHWIKIGTAGGCSKPSTGYTFHFAEKHSKEIVKALLLNKQPPTVDQLYSKRFLFYDKVLLHFLEKHPKRGAEIFYQLFKKNPPSTVFSFLHNESNILQELKIFASLPTLDFLNAAIRSLV